MPEEDEQQQGLYVVVVNDEEQYSIWRADETPPAGWQVVGPPGTRESRLTHIETIWTDMRPKSAR
jgi:MbtH protein